MIGALCRFLFSLPVCVLLPLVASTGKILTARSSAGLHFLAVTWPETGYLWLIGTKTSLKVYL